MRVHHLNAATLCPMGARFVNGRGGFFQRARLICHVLVAETNEGLVLVDTGLGTDDIAEPSRLGKRWIRQVSPRLDRAETVLAQIKTLGYAQTDVRHIIPTHLDKDHAGGLPDFPKAKVHIHRRELEAAVTHPTKASRDRYVRGHWSHGPDWQVFGDDGEDWFGFEGVRPLEARESEILIIPLPGHTSGHCGVAVRGEKVWFLHAGDAFFSGRQIETPQRAAPVALGFFQRRTDTNRDQRKQNQERLRQLHALHGNDVTIINAHDPELYDSCRSRLEL